MRLVRTFPLVALGSWVGMAAAAAFAKRAVPSRGGEETDELALVAILDGVDLKSRAKAFRGGSMLAWLGGVAVDLREAELAADASLTVHTLLGGIAVRVPEGWRVESSVRAVLGGVDVRTPAQDDPDAPTLRVSGLALLGGVAIGAKAADGASETE